MHHRCFAPYEISSSPKGDMARKVAKFLAHVHFAEGPVCCMSAGELLRVALHDDCRQDAKDQMIPTLLEWNFPPAGDQRSAAQEIQQGQYRKWLKRLLLHV
jgi:hypothetical protein